MQNQNQGLYRMTYFNKSVVGPDISIVSGKILYDGLDVQNLSLLFVCLTELWLSSVLSVLDSSSKLARR